GTWSGGSGSFTPNASDLNAVYTPSQSEINNGSVTLTLTSTGNGGCVPVTDEVTYTFGPSPTAEAGDNIVLCANNAQAQLEGSVTIATGGTWSGGNGTFSPNANDLDAVYTPSADEIANGSVTLTLTTTGNGDCNPAEDQVTITFTPTPTANAGNDVTVCANAPDVNLNASVNIASGGVWSGGTGTFSPDANTLNAVYTPSADEIADGSVTLTLTTTGNGDCVAVTDQMTITITPAPVVDAGNDRIICSNNAEFQLDGSVLHAGGGQWSGGLGTFSPSKNDLNATYTPTLPEIVSGTITFVLTSTDNGGCVPVQDEMTVTFSQAPTVDAGEDFSICAGSPAAQLSGEFTVATNAQWTGGSGTFTPNALAMDAVYHPTPQELADGSVTLTLVTIGNGNCLQVTDDITISFDPEPTVDAGSNLVSCANSPNVVLGGTFSHAAGVQWSGGTGFFNPSNQDPNATYTPSAAEITNGSVTLTLTTFNSGECPGVSDQTTITINPAPIVDAGPDQDICSNNSLVTLNGSITFAGGGQWSGGNGEFTPGNTVLNAQYQPTAQEISNGFVTLTLTSTDNGFCEPVSDQVTIHFTPSPVADAGSDMTLCANNPEVSLSGSFTVADGAVWSGGTGTFVPDNTTPHAVYTPSQSELNNGSVTLTLTTFGNGNCLPASDQVEITFTPAPEVSAGEDYYACVDNLAIPLNGAVEGGATTGQWTTSGTGVFIPNAGSLNASYLASSLDSLTGQVTLTLTSTNNGNCLPVSDSMNIYISPAGTANAGPDQDICINNPHVELNGIIGGAATEGVWTTSGTGMFLPNPQVPGATYLPSDADLSAGTVTLTFAANSCNQASDEMTVTFTPAPEVDAGPDIITCSSQTEVQVNGSVWGANTTGLWTTTGSGTFSPSPTALNPVYIFSAEDVESMGVSLILTSTNVGNCHVVSDTLQLHIFHQGTVDVGEDAVMCDNNPELQLNPEISGGDEVLWTSTGTGSFVPNNTTLNATYVPSPGDLVNGSVNLAMTLTNSCNAASDFLNLSFIPGPVANAGEDIEICGEVAPFHLDGEVNNAGGGQWTTLGSGTFQNANNLNTFYVASQDDIDSGGVQLVLTTTDNGNCFSSSDTLHISISTGVVVDAGPDRQACSESGQIQLTGSVSEGSSTGVWTTDGNGYFTPNANALNAVYNFTPDDIANGSVVLTLTSTNNGICEEQSDSFVLTFGDQAFVFAGEDIETCETTDLILLNGVVSGDASTGVWTTSGTGTFFPSSTSLSAYYEPSDDDIDGGSVVLTLTSTNSTLCSEGSSELEITFQYVPTANAGNNAVLCGDIAPVQLLGSVNHATGGVWTTSGTGEFLPNDSVLTAMYVPSVEDSIAGGATLTLTTYGDGLCAHTSDQIVLSFADAVTVSAGADIEVCETAEVIPLNGTVQGSPGMEWTTSGTGTFNPSANQAAVNYLPSADDVANGEVTLYLSAESNGNCPAGTDSLKVVFDALPVIEVDDVWEACTTSPEVSLSAQVFNSDDVLWSGTSGGTFEPNNTGLSTTYVPSQADLDAGSATITLSATSSGACGTVTETIELHFIDPAVVNAGNDMVICATQTSVPLNGSVSGSTTTGVWSTNSFGGFTDNQNLSGEYLPGANDLLVGFADLILTSTENGPCEAVSDTVHITINPKPVVNAGEDRYVCRSTGVIELSGTVQNETEFMWNTFGDGVFLPSENEISPEYVIGVNDANTGIVELELVALGLEGCAPVRDTMTVHISHPLSADFTFEDGCVGQPVQFNDGTELFEGEISGWTWNFGGGAVTNVQNPRYTYDTPGSHVVTLIAHSSLGCADTITDVINISASPTAAFDISTNPAPTEFDVLFTDQSTGAFEWLWNFGDGSGSSDLTNPTYAYAEGGDYIVTLVVTGTGGCTDSTRATITIEGDVVLPPRLPNTFSPNDDGLNDVYYVHGGPFTQLDFRVYDGWGREIFKSTNQDIGWDGTDNGKQVPTGVYVYTVKATNTEGNTYDYSGQINLVR
ncbi:MAG TPA: PKD domain-containing protein, partial [Cryomorphaceae bacterium]|nr:PKD domain-containing protein [Cryomorphaceae bacterium]